MKNAHALRKARANGGALVVLAVAVWLAAHEGRAGAAPTAAPSSSVAPPAPVKLAGADIPDDPGKAPTGNEWARAKDVVPNVGGLAFRRGVECKAQLLSGWLRITCLHTAGAGLVAGDPRDLHVSSYAPPSGDDKTRRDLNAAVSIVELPLRRGESHVVSFLALGDGYMTSSPVAGPTFQIGWRKGAPEPMLFAIEVAQNQAPQ